MANDVKINIKKEWADLGQGGWTRLAKRRQTWWQKAMD